MENEKQFLIDIKKKYDLKNDDDIRKINNLLRDNGYRFETKEGIEFDDYIYERMEKIKQSPALGTSKRNGKKSISIDDFDKDMQTAIKKQLNIMNGRRRALLVICLLLAIFCIGYFINYYYLSEKNDKMAEKIAGMKQDTVAGKKSETSVSEKYVNDDGEEQIVVMQVLQKYETLYNTNKNLIGWIKIDDTNIDYPVLQSDDNDYYLNHNFYDASDKNGSIFLDAQCNVVKQNDNMIIYGHHMKSGNMFGNLDLYSDYEYYKKHRYIQFDTIYSEGLYEIMYVFRSRIYTEDEIRFKYYQFIDVNSAEEFDSCLNEMSKLSLYDTGVKAGYGDKLITLSTCDYQEKNGRFVVVAKKVK